MIVYENHTNHIASLHLNEGDMCNVFVRLGVWFLYGFGVAFCIVFVNDFGVVLLGAVYGFGMVLLGVVYGFGRAWCMVLVWFW